MATQRKLGRTTDQRKAMLKGLVTALIENGKIETTEKRAKEVKNIVENLIAIAAKEVDNVKSEQVTVSKAKVDAKGNKVLVGKTSKNGRKYDVVEREVTTETVAVDMPSRLHARKQCAVWVYKKQGKNNKPVLDTLFDDIAPRFKDRKGGYTRIYKMGPRRGDGAEVAILEILND